MIDDHDDRVPSGTPSIYSLDKSVEVLRTELKGFMRDMNRRLDNVDGTIKDSLGKYATKDDLAIRDEAIADIRRNITWAARIVISAVILGVLALVFKAGVLHG